MRIRKLISQKKISAPNPSSNNLSSSVSSIPSSCPAAAAATSAVSTSITSSKEKEEERVNNLQKQHIGACELNMAVWDVTQDDELLYYRKGEEVSKVIKNEDKEQEHYDAADDDHKITVESVNAEESKISIKGDDDSESEKDDEETEEEELKEEQYATEDKGKLGLNSVMHENVDKRKREYEQGDIESEEFDHEETEDEEKNNKRKRESDYEEEEKKCSMKNGKRWHCQSKAQTGNSLCKHHLIQKQQRIFRKLNKITTPIARPGLKSVMNNDDNDKKRKRHYEENHIESEKEDIEETEVDNEGKLGLKSEKKKNKRKLESDSDSDYEEETSESQEDDEETEEEELKEKQYATENKGKLGIKSVMNENDDKKRKREYDQETEVYHEEAEDDQKNNKRNRESDYDYHTDYEVGEKKKKKGVVYCSVRDGKGWHCRSKAQTGNSLCKHHLVQKQQRIFRKSNKIPTQIGRPPKETRTNGNGTTTGIKRKNKSKLSGKKSSEFYYYSGFGPLWGKSKRGRSSNEVKKQPEDSEEKLDEERKVIIDEALMTHGLSPVKVKEENVNVNDTDNGCNMFVDDEFDDDYNTDEDCNGVNGKTKKRKSIKARSLNSLF